MDLEIKEKLRRLLASGFFMESKYEVPVSYTEEAAKREFKKDLMLERKSFKRQSQNGDFCIITQTVSEIISDIEASRRFIYLRLPHGLWDTLSYLRLALKSLSCQLESETSAKVKAFERDFWELSRFNSLEPTFISEFRSLVKELETNGGLKEVRLGIAFNGPPLPLVYLHEPWIRDSFRAQLETEVCEMFPTKPSFYDATNFKRLAIQGDLSKLICMLRQRFDVILVANDDYQQFCNEFLGGAKHYIIPHSGSHELRVKILSDLSSLIKLKKGNKRLLLITQMGGSLAFWMGVRLGLQHPDISFIDFGQSLQWFVRTESAEKTNWIRMYRES